MAERVAVTGATGSIGAKLVERLLRDGQPVRAVARNPEKATGLTLQGAEVVVADLEQPETLRAVFDGCDVVIHTAALLTGRDREKFQRVNVDGTAALVQELARAGVQRLVHLSSTTIYGFPDVQGITEEQTWQPTQELYAVSKQQQERVIWDGARSLAVTMARSADVIGPDQGTWTVEFLSMIERGLLNPPTHAGFLNPVYIDNLVDALIVLAEHPAAAGEAFNVVDGTPVGMDDYIRTLADIAGKRVFSVPAGVLKVAAWGLQTSARLRKKETVASVDTVEYLLHRSTYSNEKLRARTGWAPRVDLETAFERIRAWYREKKNSPQSPQRR